MTTKNEARQDIESSFKDVPYPGDANIGLPRCLEGERATEIFKGQHWKNLSLDQFGGEYPGPILSVLTPQAFHFFLPGFLLLMMENRTGAELLDVILFAITPADKSILESLSEPVRQASMQAESRKATKFKLLSLDQKKAILACLNHMKEQYPGYVHDPLQRAYIYWQEQVR